MTSTGRDGGQQIRAALPVVASRLPTFLPAQRWYGGKERAVERAEIRDTAVVPDHPGTLLAIVDVYTGLAEPATYFLPLGLAELNLTDAPGGVVARHGDLVVRDAIGDPETCRAILRGIVEGRTLPTAMGGRFIFQPARRQVGPDAMASSDATPADLPVRHAGVEQSNSSVIFGDQFVLKALRRLSLGTNPEIEIPRFLGEYTSFDRVPALIGWAEYQAPDGSSAPVGVLQRFVRNVGDGWAYVLRRVASVDDQRSAPSDHGAGIVSDLVALGRTLAALHLALASRTDVPDFAPEPIDAESVEVWKRRTLASLDDGLLRIAQGLQTGPAGTGWSAEDRRLGDAVQAGAGRLRAAIDNIEALADGRTVRTRHHGDFHLGQTLVADDGWVIIDFEGEPLRSLEERRAKQTPLRDLAGLLRSLDYARATATRQRLASAAAGRAGAETPSNVALDELFAQARQALVTAYVETVRSGGAPLLPASDADLAEVLLALEVEKALYELTYELGNRPDWVSIPLGALARLAQGA